MSAPPLLTIAVPTYGRRDLMERLVGRLDDEFAAAGVEDVRVLVSDNASDDGTWEMLQEAAASRPWLVVHRQDENVGPVRNMQWLIANASDADYLWVFGDDDLVRPGGLAKIAGALREHRPAWLHLPHIFVTSEGEPVQRSPVPETIEVYENAGALWRAYHHWLTFLTGSIVHADAFREANATIDTPNEYIPLLWFFRAGLNGPCVVLDAHVLDADQTTSWGDRAHKIQTLDFTSLWDDGLMAGMSEAEFGATLDGLYTPDWGIYMWRQQPIEELMRVVARFPQSRSLRGYLWEIAREHARADAVPILEMAAAVTGDAERAQALIAEGEALYAAGNAYSASVRFTEATAVDPTRVDGWNNLAVVVSLTRKDEAAELLRCALFVAPEDQGARANLAALEAAGD